MAECKPGYWAVLPADVRYDDKLRPNAKLIYAEITALQGKDGYCFASNDTLGKWYGLTRKTISELVAQLRELGYIEIEIIRDPVTNAITERRIRTIQQAESLANPIPKKTDTPIPIFTDTPIPKKRAETNTSNLPVIPPKAPHGGRRAPKSTPDWKPERFEGFWKFYPRGENRQAAVRAWDKLRPDDLTIAKMGTALARQKQSEDWKRGIGIPYASTWLNGRRWEDERRSLPSQIPGAAIDMTGGMRVL